ncbi:MAG: acyl-CoA dehydrogenase [Gammaproteobacteria bacterium]
MTIWLTLLLFLASILTLAVLSAPAIAWGVTGVIFLVIVSSSLPIWLSILAWLTLVPLAALFAIPSLRLRFFSTPVMHLFRAVMPPISDTEREALEAGSTWWEADLFGGKPDWNALLALPAPALTNEEQAFVDGPTNELCKMINDWEITEELHDLPESVWQFIREQGFFGMIIPKRYGGLAFSAHAHSTVVMKLSARSISAAVTVMVPNSLGPAQLLLHYGTQEQKDYYLPRLARGEEIPCFALTGPDAGSDAAAMPDTGIICKQIWQEKETLGIRLNWEKRYITLGPVATVLGLAFKLYDPDHLIGEQEALGITVALIPTDTPGIDIGRRHYPMSQAFMNGPNSGHDVFIPMDWIIGGQDYIGQGWRMLMESLADGRSISLPAVSTGAAKHAARTSGAYAATRKQFKMAIGQFEGVSDALGRIAGMAYGIDAVRGLTTLAVDRGGKPAVASAIAKYHLTERMRIVVNDAMDIHGGRAVCMGPNNYLARGYEGIPISITVEGANILTRSLIIFGQGAIRCHPWLLKEMEAATNKQSDDFDHAFGEHVKMALSNLSRALLHGLSASRLANAPSHPAMQRHCQHLSRISSAFSITAEAALLTLGGSLKRRESLSGRLGDVLSHLYFASAALKHFADQGYQKDDQVLLDWCVNYELYHAQQRLDETLDNLPNRFVGVMLKRLVFPFGKTFKRPADSLTHQAADLIMQRDNARERLTGDLYNPISLKEPLAQLEDAMHKTLQANPILRKIRDAIKQNIIQGDDPELALDDAVAKSVITGQDANLVQSAITARKIAIAVDDFPADFWLEEKQTWANNTTPSKQAGTSI